ncbi:MAG: TetR/AcrR family transcriptional regulator [Dehalococcoidia bacterium]|nr:MAG: TetR/AcrR family transcriptional regulator [Dehalococcoidia bacterium]
MTEKLFNKVLRRSKRQFIIETTVDLFTRTHDVRKVTIEDIAAAAGVSPTTVYNQFGNRDALVVEAAKDLIRDIFERSRTILRSDMPFGAKMSGMISGKLDIVSKASDEVISKIITQDKKIAPFLEDMFSSEVKQLWLEMLDDGKRQGYIDESIDPEAFYIYMDIVRAGFTAKGELFTPWKQNIDLIEKMTHFVFYGFLQKDVDLF